MEDSGGHHHPAAQSTLVATSEIVNSLHRHKYAILLTALLGVTLVESFSQRLLRPLLSDVVLMTIMVLVFLIVSNRAGPLPAARTALVSAER